jgi:hypothetical protein
MARDPAREMAKAVDRLTAKHGALIMNLDWLTVVTVLAQLELALRHPDAPPMAGEVTRRFLTNIYALIGTEEPKLVELLKAE